MVLAAGVLLRGLVPGDKALNGVGGNLPKLPANQFTLWVVYQGRGRTQKGTAAQRWYRVLAAQQYTRVEVVLDSLVFMAVIPPFC